MTTKAVQEQSTEEAARPHQARALGNVASNIVDQINQANRQDVKEAYDGVLALVAGDYETVKALLLGIAARNQDFWEVGILTRAAEFTEADKVIMAYHRRTNPPETSPNPSNKK